MQPQVIDAILDNASLVYFDGRLTDCATLLAKAARQRGVPVLVEAERPREGLDELLEQADYLCTSPHFPKVQSSLPHPRVCLALHWSAFKVLTFSAPQQGSNR